VYRRNPRARLARRESPMFYFDFDDREEKDGRSPMRTVAFGVTFDGKRLLVSSKHRFAIVESR